MKIDLDDLSRKELESLRADIDKTLKKRARSELKAARIAAEKAAQAHGFSLAEVLGDGAGGKGATGSKSAPKYANPEDPTQTWTGRGRQPGWAKAALAEGKSLDDLLI